jgi:hypothetical protein
VDFFNHGLKIRSQKLDPEPKRCCSDHRLVAVSQTIESYNHKCPVYFLLPPPHADSKICGSRLGTDQSVLPQVWERTAAGSLSSSGSCARCFFFAACVLYHDILWYIAVFFFSLS